MLASPIPQFTEEQCRARLKKWRHRLRSKEAPAVECWGNIDVLLEALARLLCGELPEKPWETDDPVPDGA